MGLMDESYMSVKEDEPLMEVGSERALKSKVRKLQWLFMGFLAIVAVLSLVHVYRGSSWNEIGVGSSENNTEMITKILHFPHIDFTCCDSDSKKSTFLAECSSTVSPVTCVEAHNIRVGLVIEFEGSNYDVIDGYVTNNNFPSISSENTDDVAEYGIAETSWSCRDPLWFANSIESQFDLLTAEQARTCVKLWADYETLPLCSISNHCECLEILDESVMDDCEVDTNWFTIKEEIHICKTHEFDLIGDETQVGKCLFADDFVSTRERGDIKLRDVKTGDSLARCNGDWMRVYGVLAHEDEDELYKIITNFAEFSLTAEHYIPICNELGDIVDHTLARDAQVGQIICGRNKVNGPIERIEHHVGLPWSLITSKNNFLVNGVCATQVTEGFEFLFVFEMSIGTLENYLPQAYFTYVVDSWFNIFLLLIKAQWTDKGYQEPWFLYVTPLLIIDKLITAAVFYGFMVLSFKVQKLMKKYMYQ